MTEKPVCKLSETDSNAFAVIGRVSETLKRAGEVDKAKEFCQRAFASTDYDKLLQLCFEYVEVE